MMMPIQMVDDEDEVSSESSYSTLSSARPTSISLQSFIQIRDSINRVERQQGAPHPLTVFGLLRETSGPAKSKLLSPTPPLPEIIDMQTDDSDAEDYLLKGSVLS